MGPRNESTLDGDDPGMTRLAFVAHLPLLVLMGCAAPTPADPAVIDATYLDALETAGVRTGNASYERGQAELLCNFLASGATRTQADLHLTQTYDHLTTQAEIDSYMQAATSAYCPERTP